MLVVWKYELDMVLNLLELPSGATPLCVQMQGNRVCMWVECNPTLAKSERLFRIVATGHEMPVSKGELAYVDTVQHNDLVWHVYEDRSTHYAHGSH